MIHVGGDVRVKTGHERFQELAALANAGALDPSDWSELKGHLEICEQCCMLFKQYLLLAKEGMPLLAARYSIQEEPGDWDDTAVRHRLFGRLQIPEDQSCVAVGRSELAPKVSYLRKIVANPVISTALVACLIAVITLGIHHSGGETGPDVERVQRRAEDRFQDLMAAKKAVDEQLSAETEELAQLQQKGAGQEYELTNLRSALHTLQDRLSEIRTAKREIDQELQTTSEQRDTLSEQLREIKGAYQKVEAELANLRSDREQTLLQTALLKSKIEELSAANDDQERKLRDDEQYLAEDRDIRDLMGARQLYIADVFDVSSDSLTRKPYGRVFFTRGKSLIFYAFDLDRQPGIKSASTFQAWGRTESDRAKSLNLGILYMDNEENRRWVLRCDDSKQLAEIDAVFVTVEPHGGSQKPTGKPYLYALLRKEANHP